MFYDIAGKTSHVMTSISDSPVMNTYLFSVQSAVRLHKIAIVDFWISARWGYKT